MIEGNIEEMLLTEGVYITTTVGVSMYPLLKNRRDNVVIRPTTRKLKKYDVPLYKRGEKYLLHRIIKVTENGYIIRGDNCENKEYDITDEKIIGVLDAMWRKEKFITVDNFLYKCYSRLVVFFHPAKMMYRKTRGVLSKIKHKVFRAWKSIRALFVWQ